MNKKESDIVNPPVEDATYTAQYEEKLCTIKFYGLNNDLIKSYENIEIGSHVKVPEVPEVEHYTFTGWNPPIIVDSEGYTGAITKSIDFYAEYDAEVFHVSYCSLDENGVYHIDVTYDLHWGDAVPTYSVPDSDTWGRFLGWIPEYSPTCQGSVTYKPRYYDDKVKYRLKRYDWDGNLAGTYTLSEGTNLYDYMEQFKYDDFSETIRFIGYYYLVNDEKVFITESSLLESNIELYPDFTNPICTIEFFVWDELFERLSVKAGHKFTVPDIPEKPGYGIIGWFPAIVNPPVGTAMYVAQYAVINYRIRFFGIDDNLLSEQHLNSGETVVIPEVPDVGELSFVKWNEPVSPTAVADAEYFACPEQSEITFTYYGETYTHGVFSYETMNDLYEMLRDSHKSLRYKDEPYYKSYRYETIKSIKYSSKVKHAVMSEYKSYYDIEYDSLDELGIEINSNLISAEKYINELTVKDTVRTVNLINVGTTYNKIVDLSNVERVYIDYEYVSCYFGFKKLIIPGDSIGSIYNTEVVHFVKGTGLPSDIQNQIQYGNHRIIIGDGIYDNISDIPDYKLNENVASTNTDNNYFTLIADNEDWIDEENIYIYDSKKTRILGTYNIETYVFTKIPETETQIENVVTT